MMKGYFDEHLDCIFELDLVRYHEEEYVPTEEELEYAWQRFSPPKTIGIIEVTDLGYRVLAEGK
jgi:hypothetical protein